MKRDKRHRLHILSSDSQSNTTSAGEREGIRLGLETQAQRNPHLKECDPQWGPQNLRTSK